MDANTLEQILIVASKYGVVKMKLGELELELLAQLPQTPSLPTLSKDPLIPNTPISNEDLLFWSSESPKTEPLPSNE